MNTPAPAAAGALFPAARTAVSPGEPLEEESITAHLGIWTFLATEVLFFGGMFVAYTLYRLAYPAAFAAGAQTMEFGLGTANTAILLTSSLFMAIADLGVKAGRGRLVSGCLATTFALGAAFLAIKGFEYYSKYAEGLIPGPHFAVHGSGGVQLELFLVLYFGMTGLHAAHMIAGLIAVSWLWRLHARGRLNPAHAGPIAVVGLYWHFVDCIWVFLYPMFYLAGR